MHIQVRKRSRCHQNRLCSGGRRLGDGRRTIVYDERVLGCDTGVHEDLQVEIRPEFKGSD